MSTALQGLCRPSFKGASNAALYFFYLFSATLPGMFFLTVHEHPQNSVWLAWTLVGKESFLLTLFTNISYQ